jgi:hypothetical protein
LVGSLEVERFRGWGEETGKYLVGSLGVEAFRGWGKRGKNTRL